MTFTHYDVSCIGNALVDIIGRVDDSFILQHGLTKSHMHLCDEEKQSSILSGVEPERIEPGGSAANTASTLAALGAKTAFHGSVGNDLWGKQFETSMVAIGCDSYLHASDDQTTGTSVILVTSDSERTMNTHLGAAGMISADTINSEIIESSQIVYIEGYLYDREEQKHAVHKVIEHAHAHHNRVSISLSDPSCVQRHLEDFRNLLPSIDILFANEAEMCELWGVANQLITSELIEKNRHLLCPLTVITQSERGCTIVSETVQLIPAGKPEQLRDLTGAGDQFAAGFLYGITQGYELTLSATLAVELATRVIEKIGPRLTLEEIQTALTSLS